MMKYWAGELDLCNLDLSNVAIKNVDMHQPPDETEMVHITKPKQEYFFSLTSYSSSATVKPASSFYREFFPE